MPGPLHLFPLALTWDDVEDKGPEVALVLGVLAAAWVIFTGVFPRLARAAILRGAHPPDEEIRKRADTIISVVERTTGVALAVIAVITVLGIVGVEVTAIITGLGITGLALALGAQALVRDAINGIFLLAEDQYRRGDVIRVADVTGTVEEITLRRTILRDEDGVVHSVPNGSITVVSNYTRDFAVVNVPVRVAYGEDLSRVRAVVDRVAAEIAADQQLAAALMEKPAVKAVESVGEQGVTVTVSARARPGARWLVANELRRRLAEAFLAEEIHVPFPVYRPGAEPPPEPGGAPG